LNDLASQTIIVFDLNQRPNQRLILPQGDIHVEAVSNSNLVYGIKIRFPIINRFLQLYQLIVLNYL